jgi:hypothetical protein
MLHFLSSGEHSEYVCRVSKIKSQSYVQLDDNIDALCMHQNKA